MASAENTEEKGSTPDPALTDSQPDNPDRKSDAPNAQVLNPHTSTTPSAKPQSFAELSRLAQESKSSWQADMPGRKADRDFLLLIIITILLLLAIMLIGGYREPIAAKLNFFKEEFTEVKNTVFPDTDEAKPTGKTSAELLSRISRLEDTVSDLSSRIRSLEAVKKIEATGTSGINSPASPSSLREEPSAPLKQKASAAPVKQPVAPKEEKSFSNATAPNSQQAPVTEPEAAPLPASLGANWFINIGAYSKRNSAEQLLLNIQTVIANAAIQEIVVQEKTLYRIRATGYASRFDAELDAKRLESSLGLEGAWIAAQNE